MTQAVEKTTRKKWKIVSHLLKWGIALVLFMLAVFLLAHFALQYGIHIAKLSDSLKQHWLMWFIIRTGIYVVTCVLLYKTYQRAELQMKQELKKIVRALVICIVVVEIINLVQLVGV